MDTITLKEYIYENEKIEFILEKIGCHHIKYHPNKEFFSCANFNGDNPNAVNVKNNKWLNVRNWTREKIFGESADIITLVEYNKSMSFVEAVKYIHKILDIEYRWNTQPKETKKDPLDIFKKFQARRTVDVAELNTLNENVLDVYEPLLHISWFRDGIMPWTAKKFGLAYSYRRNRVIIPIRYWLTGELLGINSRTTVANYKMFGIKKFFITPSYLKHLNIYGLYENMDAIKKAGYVVVYEAEKSVLKRDSLNDSTGVALSGHSISDEQVRILIGLDVDIVIALDKDISIEEVWFICEKFYGVRNVYFMFDKYNLLDEKDSPADAPNKVFEYLFRYKIKYDESEHKKYIMSKEGKLHYGSKNI